MFPRIRSQRSFAMLAFGTWVVSTWLTTAAVADQQAMLATYDQRGETYFALGLQPGQELAPAAARDVVVLFDTSASQTGVYRDDALAALEELGSRLSSQDRVRLVAVDIRPADVTGEFVAAN
ncbi:MAG: hypothetical protein KDA99_23995, partial [Planctomycetales bacterium]|nr:hypothetical protein [Planctomycetales bacterium]